MLNLLGQIIGHSPQLQFSKPSDRNIRIFTLKSIAIARTPLHDVRTSRELCCHPATVISIVRGFFRHSDSGYLARSRCRR